MKGGSASRKVADNLSADDDGAWQCLVASLRVHSSHIHISSQAPSRT